MCLAVPARVTHIDYDYYSAEVDIMGNKKTISVVLVPEAKTGDWVLIHAGEAISLISAEDAEESLKVWDQLLNE